MKRRFIAVSAVLAVCLSGCAANKDFEKEILGHPAPESPSDTGWSRQSAPPPAPPVPPRQAPPAPYAPEPMPAPPVASAPYTPPSAPVASPQGGGSRTIAPPVVEPVPPVTDARFAPKPFKPGAPDGQNPETGAPAAPASGTAPMPGAGQGAAMAPPPAPQAAAAAAPMPEPAGAPSDRATFTFMVGSFAHSEKAGELMTTLEARGFSTRMDQGKLNNKTFYKVYAVKEGNRAELEGELFAAGVTEPRLTEERPLDRVAPAKAFGGAAAKVAPAGAAKATSPKQSGNIAPPVVEPAPPLPDGYVPPPPKASGS